MSDSAYFVGPPERPGPGVLLLHSWWGLTRFFKDVADRLADAGFTVIAPDLFKGRTFADVEAAERHLSEFDANDLARLTLSSAGVLASKSRDDRIGLVGFSMGASLGLWASVRMPGVIDSVAAFYGTQSIDFDGSTATYQIHLAENDPLVSADDAAFMEATIGLAGRPIEMFDYPGTEHWFFEADREQYAPAAAEIAWSRTVGFLSACASDRS